MFYSQIIGQLNKMQCNYNFAHISSLVLNEAHNGDDFAHISRLVLNEAHVALQGEGFDSRRAQHMHPSILAIHV